jgi:hypothetical protein
MKSDVLMMVIIKRILSPGMWSRVAWYSQELDASISETEYADTKFDRNVGKFPQAIRRHIPEYGNLRYLLGFKNHLPASFDVVQPSLNKISQ